MELRLQLCKEIESGAGCSIPIGPERDDQKEMLNDTKPEIIEKRQC